MKIMEEQLDFINKVSELIRDIGESGVEYITYKQINDIDRLKDKLVEHHNLKQQTYFNEQTKEKQRAWYSDYVRHDDPEAWNEKE